jgi:hydroxymethylbilane synthase
MPRPLRVATRGSELARWQAARVATLLGGDVELVIVTTTGDTRTDVPIHALGGTGIFVKEVQQAVLEDRADVAVHSAKDLPASPGPTGIVLAAVPERADPRDALVGSTLADLPAGARIGTGSVRRRAQLAALRPDLTFAELRGNIPTRLERAGEYDAVVVAAAALQRLGRAELVAEYLEPSVMVPQVGQGALAVECRTDDAETRALLAAIDDTRAHAAVGAERAYLAQLGGGCDLPCGAFATLDGNEVVIDALLASADGHIVLRASARDVSPVAAGTRVADELLERGGRSLLDGGDGFA